MLIGYNKKLLKKLIITLYLVLINAGFCFSQVENIRIDNEVYSFLKKMSVAGIIKPIHDDNPSMSRGEITKRLAEIDSAKFYISKTDREFLEKYKIEFIPEKMNKENTSIFLKDGKPFLNTLGSIFTSKKKYLYFSKKDDNSIYADINGNFYYGAEFIPQSNKNSSLFDIGFDMYGTLFGKIGYELSVLKGGSTGDGKNSILIMPHLRSEFKFNEQLENIRNYNFTTGYVRYYNSFSDDADISVQLGREKIKYGYGYSESLILSGAAPDMDFLKLDFNYSFINFSSIHASMPGTFSVNPEERYTKFFAANKIKLTLDKLFDIGIGESIIYSGRGIELAYLTPLAFYKFVEISLQDRDNGTFFMDFQTHFIKNAEFSFTLFLDENPIGTLVNLNSYENKTAFQAGIFLNEPAGIKDLTFELEYTQLRPYVYTHANPKNTFTGYGVALGNTIGPNSDMIYSKLKYNFSSILNSAFEFRFIRKGNNIYDDKGNLIKNVGSDINIPYRHGIDSDHISFLEGNRENTYSFKLSGLYEPFRGIKLELNYLYNIFDYIYKSEKNYFSFLYFKMGINL